MKIPSEQEWLGWTSQYPMEVLRAYCNAQIENLKEAWSRGVFTYPSDVATLMKNAEALGEIKAWDKLYQLMYADILTELGDDDAVRE